MGSTDQLFASLFKRNLRENNTRDFLLHLAGEHPYFTAAQFYLLQQADPGSTGYNKQASKTSILFNNPLWLNFQLNQSVTIVLPKQQITDDCTYNAEIVELENIGTLIATTETIFENEKKPLSAIANEESKAVENKIAPKEPVDASTGTLLSDAFVIAQEKIIEPETNHENNDDEDADITDQKEIEPMNIKLNFTRDTATTEDIITFEPLHRSDYFASVGIKLSEEIKPGDKLGRQLKSFTDWLKTMKKIHEEQLPQQNEQADIVIQKMAEKSNTEAEVLTEAMAEVLLQQGKVSKAIEVYKKLSLLNPAKSTYFTDKIDQIKR